MSWFLWIQITQVACNNIITKSITCLCMCFPGRYAAGHMIIPCVCMRLNCDLAMLISIQLTCRQGEIR